MYKVNIEKAVADYIKRLPKSEQLKSIKVIKMLEALGHQLGLPYKKDITGDKFLKELRTATGTRIYYFYFDGKEYRCIWAGNKNTQSKDIKKAQKIIKDICKR